MSLQTDYGSPSCHDGVLFRALGWTKTGRIVEITFGKRWSHSECHVSVGRSAWNKHGTTWCPSHDQIPHSYCMMGIEVPVPDEETPVQIKVKLYSPDDGEIERTWSVPVEKNPTKEPT